MLCIKMPEKIIDCIHCFNKQGDTDTKQKNKNQNKTPMRTAQPRESTTTP